MSSSFDRIEYLSEHIPMFLMGFKEISGIRGHWFVALVATRVVFSRLMKKG